MAPSARLFSDDDFAFSAELVLGSAYYGAADVGEVLATCARIKDGDCESWCREWRATAERVKEIARGCEAAGHLRSAHEAWLRASTYWFQVVFFQLGTAGSETDDLRLSWRRHHDCFAAAARLADPAWERVAIPYEGAELEGWIFRGRPAGERAPLLLLNNGSDGTFAEMWVAGGGAGIRRGYNCLAFDGPGQGQALYDQGLHLRSDWEAVIGPVVDYALERDDVDPDRIALLGVSQGGYWVPRALAFEDRIAAGVADPGVVEVAAAMIGQLPPALRNSFDEGDAESFDREVGRGKGLSNWLRFTIRYRTIAYGIDSPYAMLREAQTYALDRETAQRISCPLLITSPENEQFWPAQSELLAGIVGDNATVVDFSAAEGAGDHGEAQSQALRSQRIFDWLDSQLA